MDGKARWLLDDELRQVIDRRRRRATLFIPVGSDLFVVILILFNWNVFIMTQNQIDWIVQATRRSPKCWYEMGQMWMTSKKTEVRHYIELPLKVILKFNYQPHFYEVRRAWSLASHGDVPPHPRVLVRASAWRNVNINHFNYLGNEQIADMLIQNGANVNQLNKYGHTALHRAVVKGMKYCKFPNYKIDTSICPNYCSNIYRKWKYCRFAS